ncbi:MAG: ABC transporter ATP-binding protein [Desulfobacterales bacterium]|nr:ABC transporter ATP-binding protein [Desulfobacterales bacterium]
MLLQLKNIQKIYRIGSVEVAALRNVSFAINQNEFVSIMGASGSGKSTLLNVIGCLHRPTSGRYLLENTDVGSLGDDKLANIRNRKIGFVFQSFNLLPRLTALKNVEMPLIYNGYPRGKRIERARTALESVGLGPRVNHKPFELSGGQQQRVAIARALVADPSIVLADEPTGNLDSGSEKEIMDIFNDLNKKGITIIIITHETGVANRTRRIINMNDGEIVSDVLPV